MNGISSFSLSSDWGGDNFPSKSDFWGNKLLSFQVQDSKAANHSGKKYRLVKMTPTNNLKKLLNM